MAITAEMVKTLRNETGAAFLDCKKALDKYDGDVEQAKEYLAEKGLATAKKKASREANEGIIETYTHTGSRVGVLVEVNCETDFVAATDQFKAFAHDIALQIAFSNPPYLSVEDIPAEKLAEVTKEYSDEALAQGKPENIVEKIVEGRLNKWYSETVLMKQAFIKDDELTIEELLTQAISELKENIKIRRFARFALGENE